MTFEVIIVDDASTDGSSAKLQALTLKYPNLRVLTNAQNTGFARACNKGAEAAKGRILVFLNNDTEPLPHWLEAPIRRLEQDRTVGIVGSKLLYPDHSIQHCGIEFRKTDNLEFPVWPDHRLRHAKENNEAANQAEEVQAVTGACLFIKKELFQAVGAFSTEYQMYFEDIDLCLKVRKHGLRIFYEPASVVIHHEGKSSSSQKRVDSLNLESARLFFKKWRHHIPELAGITCDDPTSKKKSTVSDIIQTHPELTQPCERIYRYLKAGKGSLARAVFQKEVSQYPEANAVFSELSKAALRAPLPPKSTKSLEVGSEKDLDVEDKLKLRVVWCAPLLNPSGYSSEALSYALALKDSLDLELVNVGTIQSSEYVDGLPQSTKQVLLSMLRAQANVSGKIVVQHVPGNGLSRLSNATVNVGRTMFETDRIPDSWVKHCNELDEIWVPSHFNLETFSASGVARHKLRVLPELVDEQEFDPDRHQPLPMPNRRGFNFLSVFEWSSRKGWDVLLSAYLREFSLNDDVCLYLKTYLMNEPDQDPLQVIWDKIRAHAERINPGEKSWPRIEVLAGQIPTKDLPRLYRAVDCLVIPSRGEGWGRPHHEAMMMGLPVIATNWSANTEFMNQRNSYLLDFTLVRARGLEPALQHYEGHRWAEPSEEHLRLLLRRVYQQPDKARARGQIARASILEKFSRLPVTSRVLQLLHALCAQEGASNLTKMLTALSTRHPSAESTVKRVGRYIEEGRSELARRIVQKELGHLPESTEILLGINRQSEVEMQRG